jgi:hypothetical protein
MFLAPQDGRKAKCGREVAPIPANGVSQHSSLLLNFYPFQNDNLTVLKGKKILSPFIKKGILGRLKDKYNTFILGRYRRMGRICRKMAHILQLWKT